MKPLSTNEKGQLALLKVLIEATKKGAGVSIPTTPLRYDLILDYQGRLYRVQVKYADGRAPNAEGAVRLCLRRRKRDYSRDEIDVVLAYLPQVDRVCWFDANQFDKKASLCLRVCPTRNGQKSGCRLVEDYVW